MNADLVSASCFQPAFDDGVAVQPLDRLYVRDGPLAELAIGSAPAPAVSPVGNEIRLEGLLADVAERDGDVDAVQAVRAELGPENALGIDRAGEDHQAAR